LGSLTTSKLKAQLAPPFEVSAICPVLPPPAAKQTVVEGQLIALANLSAVTVCGTLQLVPSTVLMKEPTSLIAKHVVTVGQLIEAEPPWTTCSVQWAPPSVVAVTIGRPDGSATPTAKQSLVLGHEILP
jgi:hypothetical protein